MQNVDKAIGGSMQMAVPQIGFADRFTTAVSRSMESVAAKQGASQTKGLRCTAQAPGSSKLRIAAKAGMQLDLWQRPNR